MKKQYFWIGLGVITLIIRYATRPEWIEALYSRRVFLWIRRLIDYGIGWFPIPLLYVFYIVLFVWLGRRIAKTNWKKLFKWQGIKLFVLNTLAFIGGTLFFFFFLWGFNYGRIPLVQQLNLKTSPVALNELKSELEMVTKEVLQLRNQLVLNDTLRVLSSAMPDELEDLCRSALEKTLTQMEYPIAGRVRGRILPTKGILLRFSSSGVYWPFVGEGNIDGGLHPLQQPFTLSHELAHGYGITNEGVCNFLAYLATQNAEDAYIKYSGLISYWRYIAIAYQRFEPEVYWKFRTQLSKGFQKDLDAINESLDKYPDILPRLRYVAYDSYLKSQGIEEGMQSYSTIIMLVRAWKAK